MPTTTSRASYDTYLAEAYPTQNFGTKTRMRLSSGTGTHRYGFVYFAGMPPKGATVFSATLSLFVYDGSQWSGTTTVTVKRVTETWSESKFTWARSGSGQGATATHAGTATVTAPVTTNQQIDIDVTAILSDIAAGSTWYGLRVEVDGTSAIRDIRSSEETLNSTLRPMLTITWSRSPDAPTSLAPSGGLAVSLQKPTLTWNFKDPDNDPQSAYQVQTCLDSTFGTVEFDTGWVTDGNTQLDLSTTAYAGLSSGDTRFWRVRAKDSNGLISPWSAAASFTRTLHGTLVMSNPPNGGFVEETTPPITTTLTGQDQVSILYHLFEQQANGTWLEIWSQGRFSAPEPSGTAFSWNLPAGILKHNGKQYQLQAWSYDGVDRVRTPGDTIGVEAVSQFTFNRSSVPAPVTGLTVTPAGPGVTLAFTRATEPDYFALRVDDVIVADRLDPAELLVSGTNYALTYYAAAPNTSHTFEVEAVVSDTGTLKHSQGNSTVTTTPYVRGIWFVDNDGSPVASGASVTVAQLEGNDPGDFTIGESSNVYYPIGRRAPVTIIDSVRGLEGTVTGSITDDGSGYLAAFRSMKTPSSIGNTYRLVYGVTNIPVQLANAHVTQQPVGGDPTFNVAVDVVQVGEFLD